MASSIQTGEERLTDADLYKVLCFLSEGEQNKPFKRRCIASAVVLNGQYLLLTSSSAIKDEDKKKILILKRYSRKHFGRYTVEACFFKESGKFTFLKIKGTPQDNGENWHILPLNLKVPSSENLKEVISSCATENFKFKFKCDGEKGTIELFSERPVEETSIVGAPIIFEESGRFFVIGVVGLTSEKQLCPCYLNESILESSPSASPNKQEPTKGSEESTESQSLQFLPEFLDYSKAESSPSASPNKQEPRKGSEESTESQSLQFPHSGEYIYISYHSKHQKAMWELKRGFESDGIRVWMDVGEKKGSTKETIAKAVGKASYVVIAMSREYQSNPKCRLEAECAYKLGKEVLPLLMENDYEPDGWLKLIVKRNRVMDFDIDASGGRHQRLKELTNTTAADDEDSDDEDSDDEDSEDGTEGSEDSTDSAESLQFPLEKTQSEEDDLSAYFHISEAEKIIQSLRNRLARGQLATEEARMEAISLSAFSDEETCEEFLVLVDVPQLLTGILRSLYQKVPDFSSEEQSNSEVECALNVIVSIYRAILNFSDFQYIFCKACGKAGLVRECLELLRRLKTCTHELSDKWIILKHPDGTDDQFSAIGDLGFNVLGVLHNLLKAENTNKYFKSCGAEETLRSFYRSQFPKYRMTALLCLAYLVDEENNDSIMATEELIKDLLKLLKRACNSYDQRCQGFSATGITVGLSYLARNDGNKKMIGQLGGIRLLAPIVEGKTDLLGGIAAFKTLYMLSLDEENKARIKAYDKKGLLKSLYNSNSEEHIFISYQWDYQKTLLLVKTELESKGFQVWMDVNEMTGNIPQTTARAMEKSSIVLLAMSRKYQSSEICSSEAAYAYKLGKKIIPLMMEENYKPDGWLGFILAKKPYMHFEKDPQEGIQQLLKEITNVTAADTC